MTLEQQDALLRSSLDTYCATMVKIKQKDGSLEYLHMNTTQQYVHEQLRLQQEATGKVRAIILKARQLGVSTYIAARFYHKTTFNWGQRTFILTHEDKSTQSLFDMAKRIHLNMEPDYRLASTTDNANELDFGGIDSGYRIGTAKNVSGLGRGTTIQNFHGSEIAFWPQADVHLSGVMQAIPDLPHTEIILESTANGVGGAFYDQWQRAERGQSQFLPIFIPWFWDVEYKQAGMAEFRPSSQEMEYQELYHLSPEQLAWMHYKNIDLGGDPGILCWKFRQEYPATPTEAFQTSGEDTLIKPESVVRARRFEAPDQSHCARVMGVDVARGGGDLTRLIDRQGRKLGGAVDITVDKENTMAIVNMIAREIDKHDIKMTFIDGCNIGATIKDRLNELGYGPKVRTVPFGSNANDKKHFQNKRAEMWSLLADWLDDEGGADIPDDNSLHRQLCAPCKDYDSNDRLILEKKKEIKKRLGFSPDGGDAAALTFAEHVRLATADNHSSSRDYGDGKTRSRDWMTL